jgi:hypothetical protein
MQSTYYLAALSILLYLILPSLLTISQIDLLNIKKIFIFLLKKEHRQESLKGVQIFCLEIHSGLWAKKRNPQSNKQGETEATTRQIHGKAVVTVVRVSLCTGRRPM